MVCKPRIQIGIIGYIRQVEEQGINHMGKIQKEVGTEFEEKALYRGI